MKRTSLILVAILCLFLNFVPGQAQTYNDLRTAVAELNSELPIPIGQIGEITHATVDSKNIVFQMEISSMGNASNVMSTQDIQGYLSYMIPVFCLIDESIEQAYKTLASLNMGIVVRITSEKNGASLGSFTISPETIKKSANSNPDAEKALFYTLKMWNATYPTTILGMTTTSSKLVDDIVVSTIIVDETQYDFDVIKQRKSVLKEEYLKAISDGSDISLFMLAILCYLQDYSIAYDFIGSQSKQKIRVLISSDDIDRLLEE